METDDKKNGCDVRPTYSKIFQHRNSPLTDLVKINHFESIYNMYLFFFFALVVCTVAYYITAPDIFHSDVETLAWATGQKMLLLQLLVTMNLYACVSVYAFKYWVRLRNHFGRKTVDVVFVILYVKYQLVLIVGPAYVMCVNGTPPVINMILTMEQLRIIMKIHSFVRENATNVPQERDNKDNVPYPSLKPFIYFMFAPTLIYRNHYPRTNEIRWNVAFLYLVKFVCILFLFFTMVMRFYIPAFKNTGLVPFSKPEAVILFFKCMMVGFCFRWCFFYTSMHFSQNMFAELLRFGDREFYQDWWNSVSLGELLKKGNFPVHDWLHAYVYLDLKKLGWSRQFASAVVYFLSAVGHEFMYAMVAGFELPHLFIVYNIGGVIISTNRSPNIVVNAMALFANAIIMPPFYIEWYARVNCPATLDKPLDYFIPRILSSTCQLIATS